MPPFQMVTDLPPRGDQPQAIAGLIESVRAGHRYTTLLGVTGSGKSVTAGTPVFLKRGSRLTLETIGEVIDRAMTAQPDDVRRQGDTEILARVGPADYLEALSFDPGTGTVSWKPVRQLVRHRSPDVLYTLSTGCGREVTVTGDHNFFVLRRGQLHLVRTTDIRPGDFLPMPRALPEPGESLRHLPLIEALGHDPRVDATEPHSHQCREPAVVGGGPTGRSSARGGSSGRRWMPPPLSRGVVAATDAPAVGACGGTRIRRSGMPAWLPLAPGLLRFIGYYVAAGQAQDACVTISSSDREVVADILAVARELPAGVDHPPGTRDVQIRSSLWRVVFTAWCGYDARSKRLPPFWPQLSNEHLAELLRAYFSAAGGVDGDEVACTTASRELASDLSYALLRFGVVSRVRPRPLKPPRRGEGRTAWRVGVSGQPFLRRFHDAIGFAVPEKRARLRDLLGRSDPATGDVPPVRGGMGRHRRARCGRSQHEACVGLPDLCWTPVRSVATVPGEGFVYDLAVQDNETFLAGWGGLFVHNTYTVARAIEHLQRPTLVLAHNKTLAAQLYSEFRQFFPHNAVRYFVSYYDYYQPEAYVPQTDLYIAKDASINDEIDRLRHAATKALMERRDVIVVASVSCIYGLGRPEDYKEVMLLIRRGERRTREEIMRRLVDIQYERNDVDFARGKFRVRGDVIEVHPAYEDRAVRIDLFGDEVDRIIELDPLTGEVLEAKDAVAIWPARHWVTTEERLERALASIEAELQERLAWFRSQGRLLEAQRLEFRTRYDMELLRETGTCPGIENYSRHLDGRAPGERPGCLLDYFPRDFLLVVDESHVTIPQVKGMLEGDRSRKRNLVEFGFRLPSAFDNRPLSWDEFEALIPQAIFVSATPGPFELEVSARVVEQIVRPTGLVDPQVEVRPARGQVDDLLAEVKAQVARGERTLITTLTKRMAEDLTAYLQELGFKVHYLHSEIDTLQRVQILKDLRLGTYDVIVGINLLREGLDLPEVSLVAILDADREGYLRSETALIQTMGRAARNVSGRVILYADEATDSMRRAIAETNRRREIQLQYNATHGITPATIVKPIRDMIDIEQVAEELDTYRPSTEILTAEELIRLAETQRAKVPWDVARLLMLSPAELEQTIEALERAMRHAAAELQFEKAAVLRDQIMELRKGLGEPFFAAAGGGPDPGRRGR